MSLGNVSLGHKPVVAELNISKSRVTKSEKWKFAGKSPSALELRRQVLMTQLLNQSGADVLVGTKVDVHRKWTGATKLTLSGYPAKYEEVRTASDEDMARIAKGDDIAKHHLLFVSDSIGSADLRAGYQHPLPKFSWYIKTGLSVLSQGAASGGSLSGLFAADCSLRILGRWYYGVSLGIDVGGLRMPSSSPFSMGLDIVPVRLGHSFYVNEDNSLDFHAGLALKWVALVKENGVKVQSGSSYLPDSHGFGAGLELGVGWRWKRLNFQVSPSFYFHPYQGSPSNHGIDLSFMVGYRL